MSLTHTSTSICRVCMVQSGALQSVFTMENFSEHALQINEVMTTCASVQVEIGDGLPPEICTECLGRLREAYAFKSLCEQTDLALRNNLIVNVKLEREDVAEEAEYVNIANTSIMKNESNQNLNEQDDYDNLIPEVKLEEADNKNSNVITISGVTRFKCNVCGKTLANKRTLKNHRRTHLDIKPHECDVCNLRYATKQNLEYHKRRHSGEKPYMCDLCGTRFSVNSNLHKHKKHVHGPIKLLQCSMCRKYFDNRDALERHRSAHTPAERTHQCDHCGKCFYNSSSLGQHVRAHTGEKSHKCLICGSRFIAMFTLRQHMKIHTGEKIFECDVCGKTFFVNANLTKHKKCHVAKQKCQPA